MTFPKPPGGPYGSNSITQGSVRVQLTMLWLLFTC